MGIEAYLFRIIPTKEVSVSKLTKLFNELKLKKLDEKFSSIYFEIVNKNSIIEFDIIINKNNHNKIEAIYSQFCVGNPVEALNDFIKLLTKIDKKLSLKLRDTQLHKIIKFDNNDFDLVKEHFIKRKSDFEYLHGKIDVLIRCDDVWERVKNNPDSRVIRWEE